ncbi:hypothetical protein [Dictyobacter aurantiacus]|uniref:hypothetical protein n=1 Tax=Dictyobacter aurantiacus TaxID=1936993 RepID=UPI000F81FD64|nr:hypothetical protein [Dictyobacter aurantiacus]
MNNSQTTDTAVIASTRHNRQSITSPAVIYPLWPTSVAGPVRSLPPKNERPVNRYRSEQMAVIDYNQESGNTIPAGEL